MSKTLTAKGNKEYASLFYGLFLDSIENEIEIQDLEIIAYLKKKYCNPDNDKDYGDKLKALEGIGNLDF